MTTILATLGWTAALLAVCGGVYNLLAAALAVRFMRKPRAVSPDFPDVSLVKPLHGVHAGLREALEGFCVQDYPGRIQIVFGVHDADDPVIGLVQALQRAHPGVEIDLVIDARLHGANRKASNLINITARAKHEVLILSDADIIVAPDYLRAVVAALGTPGIGAVTCLYVGRQGENLWSKLSAMAINYQFLPSVVLGKSLGLAQPCFGSTIALHRQLLTKIGGFAAVSDRLADDYEIGKSVRTHGYQIAMPPVVVAHLCLEAGAAALVSHELRWSRTVRQIDPAGYIGSLITYPLPLALIASALLGFTPASLGLIFTTLAVRMALKICVDRTTGNRAGSLWLILPRDVLSFGVFVASFAVNTVRWQGRRFRVGRDGVLTHP